jgi:hypothetical protein
MIIGVLTWRLSLFVSGTASSKHSLEIYVGVREFCASEVENYENQYLLRKRLVDSYESSGVQFHDPGTHPNPRTHGTDGRGCPDMIHWRLRH